MPDQTDITTIRMLTEGGGYRVPPDSGMGSLFRPFAGATEGGQVSTLETLYDFWINDVPDPDEAIRRDPNIRQKLRMHPDVASAMRKRELTVASFPDRIEPNPDAEDKKIARDVAEYVNWVWRQIPKTNLLYQQMQGAVLDGGRGHEWIWHREANGVERPVGFYAVDKSRFVFDRLGNMALRTRTEPVWGAYVMTNPQSQPNGHFPRGKFTYHMHRQEPGTWDDPEIEGYMYFGAGEDVALYYLVTFDIFVLRFRMKWLEMFGLPPTNIYYPHNWPETKGVLGNLVKQVHHQTIATIPRNPEKDKNGLFEVEYRNVPGMSYDAFQSFSDKYTKPRVDAILLGSAEEGQKSEHGGFSDHVARQDSGPNVWYRWDAKNISGTLTHQLIPPIVWGRFPNLPYEYMPILKLEPKEERDRTQESQILETATKFVPVAEQEVYDRLGFRVPKDDEKTIFNPGMGQSDPFDHDAPQMPGMMGEDEANEELNQSGTLDPDSSRKQQINRGRQSANPRNPAMPQFDASQKRTAIGSGGGGGLNSDRKTIKNSKTPPRNRGMTMLGSGVGMGRN
jgi:phage gp29-like protein